MRWKSKIWQRERMVGMILCFSVVARMKIACGGGSSSVFRNALKADVDNMWTSSMMYTLCVPNCGAMRTWSISPRISSTELFEAASSSYTLSEAPELKETQLSHWSQASTCSVRLTQLIVFARILAVVVFPTPRDPQNRKACARWWFLMALFSVVVMDFCPTTVSNVCGLYF